eukprot:RCo017250
MTCAHSSSVQSFCSADRLACSSSCASCACGTNFSLSGSCFFLEVKKFGWQVNISCLPSELALCLPYVWSRNFDSRTFPSSVIKPWSHPLPPTLPRTVAVDVIFALSMAFLGASVD